MGPREAGPQGRVCPGEERGPPGFTASELRPAPRRVRLPDSPISGASDASPPRVWACPLLQPVGPALGVGGEYVCVPVPVDS